MDSDKPAIRSRWRRLLKAIQAVEDSVIDGGTEETVRDAVAVALDALYDVAELVKRQGGLGNRALEDAADEDEAGETALGLVWARGEKTHALVDFGDLHSFGSHGYGEGPYGGGWTWQRMHRDGGYPRRFAWYDRRVRGFPVETPFRTAIRWLENRPEIMAS